MIAVNVPLEEIDDNDDSHTDDNGVDIESWIIATPRFRCQLGQLGVFSAICFWFLYTRGEGGGLQKSNKKLFSLLGGYQKLLAIFHFPPPPLMHTL